MIPVTTATKNALKQPVKQIRASVTWATSATETQTITSEDHIITLKKEAEGRYFQSTLRKITIVTDNTVEMLDRKVTVTVQVKTGASTWGSIAWGSFMISEMTVDQGRGLITYVGYGGINDLQKEEYSVGELAFPTTVGGLINQISAKFGLEVNQELPVIATGYRRLEYIQNTADAYFNLTSLQLTDQSSIEIDCEVTGASSNFACLWCCRVASDDTSTNTSFVQINANVIRADYGTNISVPYEGAVNNRHIYYSDKENYYVDGELLIARDAATITGGTSTTIWCANMNGSTFNNIGRGKIYTCRIWENHILTHDFVPCKRTSDSKAGLYDLVTGTFYAPTTGSFTAGPETYNLPNIEAQVPVDLWEKISGTTYRDILEEIAGATATIAVIGQGNDHLDFRLPPVASATETLTEANLITSQVSEKWGPANAVVISRQPQNDNVEVVDEYLAQKSTTRNLFDGVIEDGYYDATTGAKIGGTNGTRSADATMVEPETTYTLSINGAAFNQNIRYLFYAKDGTFLGLTQLSGNSKFTTPANCYQVTWHSSAIKTEYPNHDEIIQIEAGTTVTTYVPYEATGRIDVVVTNNQILDEQRETTAQEILDAVRGWEYRNGAIKTEGHGYHEVGDRIDVTVGAETYPLVITKSTILVDGGISETLTSQTPDVVPINYAKSGGITKTVYRTELEVDKQEQRIDSIVSRQDATDASVAEQFTQVTQNLTGVVATVQSTGGGNLILNSVGFGKDSSGKLTNWTYGSGATTTTIKSQSSPASLNAGAVSGHEILMTGASVISQVVSLTPGETYTLACYPKKGTTGAVTIKVGNTSNSKTITLANGTAYNWQQQVVEFVPVLASNTVTRTVPSGATLELTDLILTTGGGRTWRQASGEIYNTQVSLDQAGVQVRSSVYTGDYVEITPLEFAGYSNASGSMQKVFSLNRDVTEVEKLEARSQLKMSPIKIVPVNNSSYQGWAYVKEV